MTVPHDRFRSRLVEEWDDYDEFQTWARERSELEDRAATVDDGDEVFESAAELQAERLRA